MGIINVENFVPPTEKQKIFALRFRPYGTFLYEILKKKTKTLVSLEKHGFLYKLVKPSISWPTRDTDKKYFIQKKVPNGLKRKINNFHFSWRNTGSTFFTLSFNWYEKINHLYPPSILLILVNIFYYISMIRKGSYFGKSAFYADLPKNADLTSTQLY